MKKLLLNGAWTLNVTDAEGRKVFADVPATVPGSVYHDLLTNGLIPDPFYRDNETEALKLMENDFTYTREFEVSEDLLAGDRVLLRCEGLDTLAAITVNHGMSPEDSAALERGEIEEAMITGPVFVAYNMHRTWEYDVKALLRPGRNVVTVRLGSPTRFIRAYNEKSPANGTTDAMVGFPGLRKAHCMFGWDWGPRLPDAGIWRDISLIGVETARIAQVRVHQNIVGAARDGEGRATVALRVELEKASAGETRLEARMTAPDGTVIPGQACPLIEACEGEGTRFILEAPRPRLWWPNGLGDQPLYTVTVRLMRGDVELDRWEKRIGLRTLTVNRQKDQRGEKFCFQVNGVDVFAMGADYIPEDNLLPRVTPERTRRLLEDAKLANMNCVRVWGGGYYPDDFFYDLCDELGLIVWQDFMFACAVYNLTLDFEANIRAEFVDNVRRLRHHASLGLWCGNNEMEQFIVDWATKPQLADYIKMYEYIIPQVLRAEDPDTFYWPSSPSSGGSLDDPQDPNRGDVHYWDVWHGRKPFTEYRKFFFRFASEFGFQSFPCMATIEGFTLPEDRNAFSYVMEKHQRNASANGVIASYLSQMYLYPATLDGFVYASQLLQAQAMQYGVEHWRRNRAGERCMGAVVWQLNDCWPVVSWASIDYYGRWKALHYYEKRFFAPVLISCHEEGVLSQNTNVNAEPFELKKSARLNVSNETLRPFSGTARWSLRRPDSSVIAEGSFPVEVLAMSAVWLKEQDFSDQDTYGCYYDYQLTDAAGEYVGGGSVLFCAPKHFHFEDPGLTARVEGDEIVVKAKAYARSVEIQCGPDVLLEDNFFDMNAGERRVKILRGEPGEAHVRSVYDIR